MITPAYVRLMAQYNAEMNRRLYAAAARLTDAERKADRGAFWQSVHGTLTHLVWGDTQWMSRFDGWPKPEVGQKQSAGMVDDFATLRARREQADADIIAWANRKATILFDANTATNPLVAAARRQLACELNRRGAAVFIADLPEAVGVNGADDYLFLFGVPKLAEVLQHAHRYDWRAELIRSDRDKILGILANGITALRSAPEWSAPWLSTNSL